MTEFYLLKILSWPRPLKRGLQVVADLCLLTLCYFAALSLRFGHMDVFSTPDYWMAFLATLPVTLVVFVRLGFYRAVIRYMSLRAGLVIFAGLALKLLAMFVFVLLANLDVPLTALPVYTLLALVTVGGGRFVCRAMLDHGLRREKTRVLIYGAGQAGRQAVMMLRQGGDYHPVAFLDDNPDLVGAQIAGLPVLPPIAARRLVRETGVGLVALAIPSAGPARRAAVVRKLEAEFDGLSVRLCTLPDMGDWLNKGGTPPALADIPVEDLLGRDPVPPDPELMAADIRDQVVMVTGGAGSIGSELCRTILLQRPSVLLVLDHSEHALYSCCRELDAICLRENLTLRVVPILTSVCDEARLYEVLEQWQVRTLYHAAAYKHVPLLEDNAVAAVQNNVFGTQCVLRAAEAAGVRRFLLISSDKAVRPASVMGATKRVAELLCLAQAQSGGAMRVTMVRFGNVLDSSGSVVPLFRAQIAAGGPVTVTDPEITRWFMTIPEAAQLVIQAGGMARGGEVFVLDMGEPMRVVELARQMIRLSGYRPVVCATPKDLNMIAPDALPIVYTALRPGEKMTEELFISPHSLPTRHPRIQSAREQRVSPETLRALMAELEMACSFQDVAALRMALSNPLVGLQTPRHQGHAPMRPSAVLKPDVFVPTGLRLAGE